VRGHRSSARRACHQQVSRADKARITDQEAEEWPLTLISTSPKCSDGAAISAGKAEEHKRMFGGDYRVLNLVFSQPDGSYLDPALVR
jgi:hypothetical protein